MAVYGGVAINPQMKNMMGTEFLIATPGRLLDLVEQNALSLDHLETLIIDEADKMFQLGFEEELQTIYYTHRQYLQHKYQNHLNFQKKRLMHTVQQNHVRA